MGIHIHGKTIFILGQGPVFNYIVNVMLLTFRQIVDAEGQPHQPIPAQYLHQWKLQRELPECESAGVRRLGGLQ